LSPKGAAVVNGISNEGGKLPLIVGPGKGKNNSQLLDDAT